MFEVTVNVPAVPGVPDSSDKLDVPLLLVTTDAVTPIAAVLIAAARPDNVLSEEVRVTVCAAPLPTWMEMEPESVSAGLEMPCSVPVEACVLVPAVPL